MNSLEALQIVDIRVGTVVAAEAFPRARRPALKLRIDFGQLGTRASSAQITELYDPDTIVGRQVLAVVNLPPKRIAGFVSECLTLGLPSPDGVVLVGPDSAVEDGARLY